MSFITHSVRTRPLFTVTSNLHRLPLHLFNSIKEKEVDNNNSNKKSIVQSWKMQRQLLRAYRETSDGWQRFLIDVLNSLIVHWRRSGGGKFTYIHRWLVGIFLLLAITSAEHLRSAVARCAYVTLVNARTHKVPGGKWTRQKNKKKREETKHLPIFPTV